MSKIEAEVNEQRDKLTGQIKAGAFLRTLRTDRQLSLAALGNSLGVSASYLSNIESGVKLMSDHFIRMISDYFNIDENILFTLLGRVPLLAREELDEESSLQNLLVEIRRNKKLTDEKKQSLYNQMYKLYRNFPK